MLYDPVTKRHIVIKEEDDKLVVTNKVPKAEIKKLLDHNKEEYNSISHKVFRNALRSKNLWKAASIPNIIVEQWKKEGIDIFKEEDWPKVRAKLNSEEYRFLRTSPGKI